MTLIEDLRAAIGDAAVITDPAQFAPMLTDNRRRWHGQAACCALPASTDEVSRLMAVCTKHKALVFTQGGNTGNAAAATPVVADADVGRTVLVNTARMNQIEAIDRVNATAVVQSGVILKNLQDAAAEEGLLFPVSLAAEGTCTVGGTLSTNAGGVHVLRYGSMRAQCLGLEVVLPDGRVLSMLRSLRKDNTGYDLKHLFIGAEGTLGIITRAALAFAALPAARTVFVAAVDSLQAAEKLFETLSKNFSARLSAFELMHAATIAKVREQLPDIPVGFELNHPWYVLAEIRYDTTEESEATRPQIENLLAALFESDTVADAVIGQSETQNEALWRVRESIPSAHKKSGGNVKHDISVPRSSLVAFITECTAELGNRFSWIAPSIFGHFGDGNLHYNMGVKPGLDPRLCFTHEEAIHAVVYAYVQRFRGSVAAEHGVGRIKTGWLRVMRSPEEYEAMRSVKTLFDPENRLNPGVLFDS